MFENLCFKGDRKENQDHKDHKERKDRKDHKEQKERKEHKEHKAEGNFKQKCCSSVSETLCVRTELLCVVIAPPGGPPVSAESFSMIAKQQ